MCPLPDHIKALEDHHALTCKRVSDVIARNITTFVTLCIDSSRKPCTLYNPKLEAGSGLGHDQKQSRSADILVNNWSFNGKPAVFDLSMLSLLKPNIVSEVPHTAGSGEFDTEQHKIQHGQQLRT